MAETIQKDSIHAETLNDSVEKMNFAMINMIQETNAYIIE